MVEKKHGKVKKFVYFWNCKYAGMEDETIWEGIKQSSLDSLKRLHTKFFYQMCLFAHKSVKEHEIAEELVSDCFIKIWENRKSIEIKSSLKGYLYLMLRNSIIDHYRRKQFVMQHPDVLPDIADESSFDEQQQYASLYKALEKLPFQRRKILELAVFESKTYNEIAETLGITRNTVKTQIARAYRFLKETLDPKDLFLFFMFKKV